MQNSWTGGAGARLIIDLKALCANYRVIAQQVAPARAAAVVKADAYGLGADRVAPALAIAGCRDFFVAHLGEAVSLRPHLPADARLFILNGAYPGAEETCLETGAIPVLNSPEQVRAWVALGKSMGRPLDAAVQVDSGMSRLGLAPEDMDALLGEIDFQRDLNLVLVMSHLACGDEPDHPANSLQLAQFEALANRLPPAPRSLANSGGSFLSLPAFRQDLVRPGVSLYGAAPHPGLPSPVEPVVRLDARIIQVRTVPAGRGVGYGLTYSSNLPTRIATIGVGYADGWLRHLSNRGAAYFGDVRLPIAGRVSMDSITLDITALPEGALKAGDVVELIGPHQSVEDVARDAQTIPYEILTSLGHRYAREWIGA
ncbi:MAG TPA: alanine racemase [Pedomonas sp.]|uniref:alanine racemase n=1 Tax=Pedomonas sp. TaxID=2976421 RepID=UPI002F42EC17